MIKKIKLIFIFLCFSLNSFAKDLLDEKFKNFEKLNLKERENLKQEVMKSGPQYMPTLLTVLKSSVYPDKARWMATFLIGRIMGKKSTPLLVKYLEHPNWVLRMASLRSLLSLNEKKIGHLYAKALNDESFLVRGQALENIRLLNLKDYAPQVWAMLYDKKNYYDSKESGHKRMSIIKKAVKIIGDLKFEKAKDSLLTMCLKPKYDDIFPEIEYSLEKILNKKSPKGDRGPKRRFWSKVALNNKNI